MANYRGVNFPGSNPGEPGQTSQLPLHAATKHALQQACSYQDRLPWHGRRILWCTGLNGGDDFTIPDTDPDAGSATRHYFDLSTARTFGRLRDVALTPGYGLRMAVIAVPSGPTQFLDSSVYAKSGSGGTIRCKATWDNGSDTDTVTEDLWLPASQLQYNAQPSGDGQAWQSLIVKESGTFYPSDFFDDVTTARKWTLPGTTVDLQMQMLKSPRLVFCCVFEVPLRAAYEWADSTKPPIHGYTAGYQLIDGYPLEYPAQRADEANADPALGMWMLLEAAERQAQQLGPALFSWTSYDEHGSSLSDINSYSGGSGDDEYPAVETTSTTFVNIFDTSVTKWTDGAPGIAIGTGGYGRDYAQSNREWALRNHQGVIRSRVGVWLSCSSASDKATVRLATSPSCYIDIDSVAGTTDFNAITKRWYATCGITPEQSGQVQVLLKTTASVGGEKARLRAVWGAREPVSS